MKSPDTSSSAAGVAIFNAYAQFSAATGEPDTQRIDRLKNDSVGKASLQLGQVCLAITKNDPYLQQQAAQKAYATLENTLAGPQQLVGYKKYSVNQRTSALLMRRALDMLQEGPAKFSEQQALLHTAVIQELDRHDDALIHFNKSTSQGEKRINNLRAATGNVAEMLTLGLTTAGNLGNRAGLPGSYHTDFTPQHCLSFDQLLLADASDGVHVYPLQVKTACIGGCGQTPAYDVQGEYSSDIVLVSGHCDLGYSRRQNSFPLVDLLLQEAEGNLTSAEADELADRRGTLLDSIISDEYRRGTLDASLGVPLVY